MKENSHSYPLWTVAVSYTDCSKLRAVHQFSAQQGTQQNVVQQLVMQSMADYYKRGTETQEQMRLSRVLDVAHDLKALHILLEARPFTFVIDLACLASRREYLKLEKWLADKIREHGVSR